MVGQWGWFPPYLFGPIPYRDNATTALVSSDITHNVAHAQHLNHALSAAVSAEFSCSVTDIVGLPGTGTPSLIATYLVAMAGEAETRANDYQGPPNDRIVNHQSLFDPAFFAIWASIYF